MKTQNRYGSFTVRVGEETQVVNPLTQKELADGWRLVLPKARSERIIISNGKKKFTRRNKLYKIFRINLSQLPEHLWDRRRTIYEDGVFSHYIVKDNLYLYIVNQTPVDNEITQLFNYVNLKNNSINLDENDMLCIRSHVQTLEDNDVKGWVYIRGKRLLA
jgi:hypothetical protein